ncbi:hypothetical protein PAHAL_1G216500 [Panicum hallii]|uniref:Uncharacterized protein n=1 Tax=Panicum hallii TaxID=206008 RepID=A0A2T8KW42_9POAL|nr:hypothetical protein PAHAL_1G216500 [Panicum hallii]
MSVKMRTTCTWTERPYEALLFPGIGFGPFLRSLGGRRRRPPSGGARAISEIPLWKSSDSNLVSDPRAKGQSQYERTEKDAPWCTSYRAYGKRWVAKCGEDNC